MDVEEDSDESTSSTNPILGTAWADGCFKDFDVAGGAVLGDSEPFFAGV